MGLMDEEWGFWKLATGTADTTAHVPICRFSPRTRSAQLPGGRRLPANVPSGASARQSTQCTMNRLPFFFWFELSYQECL